LAEGDRLRFRFIKLGKIRFTSHRDVARMWERALRRSRLPVAWSEGFNPHPLLSFGLALPTGAESLAEYLDVRLDGTWVPDADAGDGPESPSELDVLCESLTGLLPEGLAVTAAERLGLDAVSLQQEVTSCSWEMEVVGMHAGQLRERIEQLLDAPEVLVLRERKGRTVNDDIRPGVRSLSLITNEIGETPIEGSPQRIRTELATQPRGVRPQELLEGLGTDLVLARACRTHQWIERDGARREPLPQGSSQLGPLAPHAQERVS
jgi:uncharacterized protein (DUF2344 family)